MIVGEGRQILHNDYRNLWSGAAEAQIFLKYFLLQVLDGPILALLATGLELCLQTQRFLVDVNVRQQERIFMSFLRRLFLLRSFRARELADLLLLFLLLLQFIDRLCARRLTFPCNVRRARRPVRKAIE